MSYRRQVGRYRKQQGAALVVALLILSLVTVLAASMTVEHNFSIRRISNQLAMQQAYSYLRGVEAIAQKGLRLDLQNDKDDNRAVDHLGEIWAMKTAPFTLENGDAYIGCLDDLQSKFNLNSLAKPPSALADGQLQPQVPYTIEQGIFIRLLQTFNDDDFQISQDNAIEITEAVVDYLDEDSSARGFNCGEDDAYYSIDGRQGHRTPNSPILSVSELRLVCNMPVELYARVRPYVTVWPLKGDSAINLNTARLPILRSVFIDTADEAKLKAVDGSKNYTVPPPLDAEELGNVIARTGATEVFDPSCSVQGDIDLAALAEGYSDFTAIKTDAPDSLLWPGAPLGLHSDYFQLSGLATINDLTLGMSSVISRNGGTIKFLARSTGGL